MYEDEQNDLLFLLPSTSSYICFTFVKVSIVLSVNQDCILFSLWNSFAFAESIELIVESVNALKPEMVMSAGRHYGTRKSTISWTSLQSIMK